MSGVEPRILREVGGLVVAEAGPLVLIVDRGNGPPAILAFVASVLALVLGGFGALTLAAAAAGHDTDLPIGLSAGLLAGGFAAAILAVATVLRIRRTRRVPLSCFRPVAVFDRAARVYLDGGGHPIAPLDGVSFQRQIQIGSSSPKLVAKTPTGTYVLLRGNPFTGGLGDLDTVLTTAVHGVRH